MGSNPMFRSRGRGSVVEHLLAKEGVEGSNPSGRFASFPDAQASLAQLDRAAVYETVCPGSSPGGSVTRSNSSCITYLDRRRGYGLQHASAAETSGAAV